MLVQQGFEPATSRSPVWRSPNWANQVVVWSGSLLSVPENIHTTNFSAGHETEKFLCKIHLAWNQSFQSTGTRPALEKQQLADLYNTCI